MSTSKKQTKKVIVSSQVFNEYDQLKHILTQVTGKDDLTDDEIVAALIDGFMQSFIQWQHTHEHHHNGKDDCCGWGHCATHTEEKKDKGECCGHCH